MAIDYGAALRGGMAVVPDYAEAEAARAQLEQVNRANSLREQQMQQEAVQQQRAIEREANWNRDLQAYLANPTTVAARDLMLRYPDQAENMRKTLESTGTDAARSTLRSVGEVHNLASHGDWVGAAALVQRRIDADVAAGQQPDPQDSAMVTMLRSGDPVEQNRALGAMRVFIASTADAEKYTSAMGRLDQSQEPTTQQRQYEFYLRRFGPQVAANWLRQQTGGTTWVDGLGIIPVPDADVPDSINSDYAAITGGGQPSAQPTPPAPAPAEGLRPLPQSQADTIRQSYGNDERFAQYIREQGFVVVPDGQTEAPAAPVQIRTRQQYDALPSGTTYMAPDGSVRVKS